MRLLFSAWTPMWCVGGWQYQQGTCDPHPNRGNVAANSTCSWMTNACGRQYSLCQIRWWTAFDVFIR